MESELNLNVEVMVEIPLQEYEALKYIRQSFNEIIERQAKALEHAYQERIKSLEYYLEKAEARLKGCHGQIYNDLTDG